MILSFLVAADENNLIGRNNQLPWHLPGDLRYFKNLTWGMPVLMGRKTFESIGRPLPGRQNIVITRNRDWRYDGIHLVHSISEAVATAGHLGAKEIFLIGGAEIFNHALPDANRIYLTRIHHRFEGDVYFNPLNTEEWKLVSNRFSPADAKNLYDHSYQVWERC